MQTAYCGECGTAVDLAAKFCRKCGALQPQVEATTQLFNTAPQPENATQAIHPDPTTPAYIPPTGVPMWGQTTTGLEEKKRGNPLVWILASLVGILLVAVVVMGAILASDKGGNGLGGGFPPPIPRRAPTDQPPQPPEPTDPPESPPPDIDIETGTDTLDKSLIYPGATVEVKALETEEGAMMQLRSTDTKERIVAWYIKQHNLQQKVAIPFVSTILQKGDLTVVVISAGDGVQIIITKKQS